MTINTNNIVSATEANQNFSKVAKLAEKKGHSALPWQTEARIMKSCSTGFCSMSADSFVLFVL